MTVVCHRAFRIGSLNSLWTPLPLLVDSLEASIEKNNDVRLLQLGDTFKVNPRYPIATDGTFVSGVSVSEYDESVPTRDEEKTAASSVIAE